MDHNFFEVDFGSDAAEKDNNLNTYFLKPDTWSIIISGRKRYIIGAKGSGKSAILKMIEFENKNCTVIKPTLKDFVPMDFDNLSEDRLSKYKYANIWKFLILTEIARSLMRDENLNFKGVENLGKFLQKIDVNKYTFYDALTIISGEEFKKGGGADFKFIKGDIEKKDVESTQKNKKIRLNSINSELVDLISCCKTEGKIFFLFDGLDDGFEFRKNEFYQYIILSLIEAIEDLKIESINFPMKFFPYVAIRSDIFDSLKDSNLNKIDENILRIKWKDEKILQIVSRRISAKYKNLNGMHTPWLVLCEDGSIPRSKDQKMLNFHTIYIKSLNKPRNFLKYIKICQENPHSEHYKDIKLTKENIEYSEKEYSRWLYKEFQNEVYGLLPIFESCLHIFEQQNIDIIDTNYFIEKATEFPDIKDFLESSKTTMMQIIEILYNYGVIGCVGNLGSQTWFHKGTNFPINPVKLCLNPGLLTIFRISKDCFPIKYDLEVTFSDEFTEKYLNLIEKTIDIMVEKGNHREKEERLHFILNFSLNEQFPIYKNIDIVAKAIIDYSVSDKFIFYCNQNDIKFKTEVEPVLKNKKGFTKIKMVSNEKVLKPNHNPLAEDEKKLSLGECREFFSTVSGIEIQISIDS